MISRRRTQIRSVAALVALVLVGWWLHTDGWPWWAWLPAAILTSMATYMIFVLTWFAYRKLTYEHNARRAKRRVQAAADPED